MPRYARTMRTHRTILHSNICLYSELGSYGDWVRGLNQSSHRRYSLEMGINYLRESFRSGPSHRIKPPSTLHRAIGKCLKSSTISRIRNFKANEFHVGNVRGFRVTKIFQFEAWRNQWRTESSILGPMQRSTTNGRLVSADPKLRMIKAASRYAQKRKIALPERSSPQDESGHSESDPASKKIKMDSDRQCSPGVRTRLSRLPRQLETQTIRAHKATPGRKNELDDRSPECVTDTDEPEKQRCAPKPPSRSPTVRKRRRSLPLGEPQSSTGIQFGGARLRTTWRNNFFRKCAELVEVRFSDPVRITCVKPFYVQYSSCFQETDAVLRLETSSLPGHQEFQATINDNDNCADKFSINETKILVRNFFQITKAYSLRHPYLVACIQTGLETRKEIYDFNKFRSVNKIIEKLCVDIPDKNSRACITQLRNLLTPQVLPYTHFETERIIAHLFAGFGPDWNTISKLTGFNQNYLKTTIALLHHLDLGAVTPQHWFDIHQQILDAYDFDPETSGRSTSRSSPHGLSQSAFETPQVPALTGIHELKRRRVRDLPCFNTVFSPL